MIRWGIIGAGNIAHRFTKGLSYSQDGKLYAIASLTKAKQERWKELYPDILIYTSYEELLADPHIDVVYIANWHKEHYLWSKKALLAKKAVLCEKPATLLPEEMIDLARIAKENHVFFMEAMKTRFIPAIIELKKQLQKGIIGDVLRVENRFCYDITSSTNTRYLYDLEQGGILNDVGSYTIASLLDYINSPVCHIHKDVVYDKGVDVHDLVTLTFESGQEGVFEVAMDEEKSPLMTVYGTKGKIICEPFYRPVEFTVILKNQEPYTIQKDYIYDDFYTEIQEVHKCLKNNRYESTKMSLQDSIDCVELTQKIREINKGEDYEI